MTTITVYNPAHVPAIRGSAGGGCSSRVEAAALCGATAATPDEGRRRVGI